MSAAELRARAAGSSGKSVADSQDAKSVGSRARPSLLIACAMCFLLGVVVALGGQSALGLGKCPPPPVALNPREPVIPPGLLDALEQCQAERDELQQTLVGFSKNSQAFIQQLERSLANNAEETASLEAEGAKLETEHARLVQGEAMRQRRAGSNAPKGTAQGATSGKIGK